MSRGSSPVLVGRTEQLAVLAEVLGDARQDGHPALFIGGEAGVGKSRLLAEFAATAPDARVLTAGCLQVGGDGTGVGGRVGFHHKTLAGFFGAIAGSGLHIRDVREFASTGIVLPRNIGLVAEK